MPHHTRTYRNLFAAIAVVVAWIGSAQVQASPTFDDSPGANAALIQVDENDLAGGPITVTDALTINFGADGPGSVEPSGGFAASTSLLSGGQPVTITVSDSAYIGATSSDTIFSFEIFNNGVFTYTHLAPFQHIGTDPIGMTFGIRVYDSDRDSVLTHVSVTVQAATPEPTSGALALLGLGGLALRRRRRRA